MSHVWITCEESPPDVGFFAGRQWSDVNKRWIFMELSFHGGKWWVILDSKWCLITDKNRTHWLM